MTYANHATDEVSTVIVSSKKLKTETVALLAVMKPKTVVGLIILNSIGHAHHNKSQKKTDLWICKHK